MMSSRLMCIPRELTALLISVVAFSSCSPAQPSLVSPQLDSDQITAPDGCWVLRQVDFHHLQLTLPDGRTTLLEGQHGLSLAGWSDTHRNFAAFELEQDAETALTSKIWLGQIQGNTLITHSYAISYTADEQRAAGRGFEWAWEPGGNSLVFDTRRRVIAISPDARELWQWSPKLAPKTNIMGVSWIQSGDVFALTMDNRNPAKTMYQVIRAVPSGVLSGKSLTFGDEVIWSSERTLQVLGSSLGQLAVAELGYQANTFEILVLMKDADTWQLSRRIPVLARYRSAKEGEDRVTITVQTNRQVSNLVFDWQTQTVTP